VICHSFFYLNSIESKKLGSFQQAQPFNESIVTLMTQQLLVAYVNVYSTLLAVDHSPH
jgi:hypothetical protein